MKTIYINGDSNTAGSELTRPLETTYCYLLAKKLNYTPIYNSAIGGASNDRIIRTTEQFLNKCKNPYPNFVLIGWSESERHDWFYEGEYRSITQSDGVPIDYLQDSLSFEGNDNHGTWQKRADWYRNFCKTPEYQYFISKYMHEKIYNLHLHLNFLNIPHLFLNTVRSFSTDNKKMYRLNEFDIPHYNWNNRFWNPYNTNGSFLEWGVCSGYQKTIYQHHKEDAHARFADILYDYIMNNNILSCPSDNY